MKRCWLVALLLVAGCRCWSTHPCVDFLDHFCPGKMKAGTVQPHGGVCIPQGPITGPGPALPSVPAIAVPVVPPPAPLPPASGVTPATPAPPPPVLFPGKA